MPANDVLLKQYDIAVELFKFYLDLIIKLNVFYYAVTGGILSFYFSNLDVEGIKYSLLLPFAMSISFALFFTYGACLMKPLREEVFAVRDALNLRVSPDLHVLTVLLIIFTILFLLVAISCSYLIWYSC
jgi:hypothetical protein